MRVITFNANGIRAAANKGFFTWLAQQHADIVGIQETKAQQNQLTNPLFYPSGYHCYYHDAEKKGYSGVALYTRQPPQEVVKKLGESTFDNEGRYLEARFSTLNIVSLYLPSGTSGSERQQVKFQLMNYFMRHLIGLKQRSQEYILCCDWNIAHQPIDLKNWRGNQNHSGFLPEERAWMDNLLSSAGFMDAFRIKNQEPGQYTWWSHRGQAWANNTGWRIDYQIITPGLKDKIKNVHIYKEQRFSDHAPLIIDYDYVF